MHAGPNHAAFDTINRDRPHRAAAPPEPRLMLPPLLLLLLPFPGQNGPAACGRAGFGVAGQLIPPSSRAPSACACQRRCATHPSGGCLAWQWIEGAGQPDYHMCYLKRTVDLRSNRVSVSGCRVNATAASCPYPPPPPSCHDWPGVCPGSNESHPRAPYMQTWQMNLSTIIQPCNDSGYTDPATTKGWGVVDFGA
jgi:hypothetical protein